MLSPFSFWGYAGVTFGGNLHFNLKSWQQLRFESTRQLEEGLTESLETYYQLNGAK